MLAPRLSNRGGADLYVRSMIHGLRHTHTLSLAVGSAELCRPAGIPVEIIEDLLGVGYPTHNKARTSALDDLVDRFRPDLIHLHNIAEPAILGWARSKPAVLTIQDHRFFCPGRGKWNAMNEICRRKMDERECRTCFDDASYADRIIDLTQQRLVAAAQLEVCVLSDYMKQELIQVGLQPRRIHIIPPFVYDFSYPQALPANDPCILFVGRLVQAKGVWDAVSAYERSGLELPLVFAGTGSLRQKLEALGYRVTGWLDRQQLAGLYDQARVLLMPSRWQEPYGIVGLEALEKGIPVVAWKSGGIAEWHPSPLALADWGEVDQLAKHLRCAVERPTVEPLVPSDSHKSIRLQTDCYNKVNRRSVKTQRDWE